MSDCNHEWSGITYCVKCHEEADAHEWAADVDALKAEIAVQKQQLDTCADFANQQKVEIERLNAEISRLSLSAFRLDEEQTAEIERLNALIHEASDLALNKDFDEANKILWMETLYQKGGDK